MPDRTESIDIKKEEINASKIYSSSGKFGDRAKRAG